MSLSEKISKSSTSKIFTDSRAFVSIFQLKTCFRLKFEPTTDTVKLLIFFTVKYPLFTLPEQLQLVTFCADNWVAAYHFYCQILSWLSILITISQAKFDMATTWLYIFLMNRAFLGISSRENLQLAKIVTQQTEFLSKFVPLTEKSINYEWPDLFKKQNFLSFKWKLLSFLGSLNLRDQPKWFSTNGLTLTIRVSWLLFFSKFGQSISEPQKFPTADS